MRTWNKLIFIPLAALAIVLALLPASSSRGGADSAPRYAVAREQKVTPLQPAYRDSGTTSALATISGTITDPGEQPVAGLALTLNWGGNAVGLTTNASGYYSYTGSYVGQWLNIHITPPISLRLAYRNWGTEEVTGNLSKDFELQDGYLLSGAF